MKHSLSFFMAILWALALLACNAQEPTQWDATLTLSDGEQSRTYSMSELHDFPLSQATVEGVSYLGVPLVTLLKDAGFNVDQIEFVIAVATDDFAATYQPDIFLRNDSLVAFERITGELYRDEQPFRMALPGQPGRMNVRMLSRIEVHS